jgi:hypothetical protein
MPTEMIWNFILSAGLGLVSWLLKAAYSELREVQVLLNRTREEMAKEYVTKLELHTDMNRLIFRLEALDGKIDRLIERFAK